MALRDEWFDGGISDLLRKDLGIESTQKMAKAVQPHIFPNNQSSDEVLKNLVEKEYSRYLELAEGDDLKFFQRTQKIVNTYPLDFPETKKILESYHNNVGKDPIAAANLLARLAFYFEHSQAQSRKTRAGSSLELQLEYLLMNNGITKFESQKTVYWGGGNSAKLDYIFPSVEHFNNDPHDCILLSCQTSSNDRIRSALAQGIEGQKYVPTLLGSSNISTSLRKLSPRKLAYVQSKGAKYVMFPGGKNMNSVMADSKAIIFYQELIDRIKQRHDYWPDPRTH
jgi:hypothetical protein